MDADTNPLRAHPGPGNGALFAAAFLVGLVVALAVSYLLALVPVPGLDRFSLIALALPVVWVSVCLHMLLVERTFRIGIVYLVIAIGASALTLAV